MQITVELRQQYGQRVIVPVCETAVLLARLSGTKTLTPNAVEIIKMLGYTVTVKQTQPETL